MNLDLPKIGVDLQMFYEILYGHLVRFLAQYEGSATFKFAPLWDGAFPV